MQSSTKQQQQKIYVLFGECKRMHCKSTHENTKRVPRDCVISLKKKSYANVHYTAAFSCEVHRHNQLRRVKTFIYDKNRCSTRCLYRIQWRINLRLSQPKIAEDSFGFFNFKAFNGRVFIDTTSVKKIKSFDRDVAKVLYKRKSISKQKKKSQFCGCRGVRRNIIRCDLS